ncbi:trypsin-like serine protease [Bdellovibrio bacteriovorus]|uniref:S1 family peptidase n=1 Tax=Bdellovibrio bacteriovorus TaxID=959 RepID=UPI0021D25F9E|nr:trypsin-like serine protease [Bdellovibrio bacteriovorus]UXR63934.1 trypsin-like serine protease [Bdellovibrio bacteriovorus]
MKSGKLILTFLCLLLAACSSKNESSLAAFPQAIVGGEESGPGDAVTQSTVSLIANIAGVPVSVCSGVLISSNLVLTAAHCVVNFDQLPLTVYFGVKLPATFADPGFVAVSEATFHKQYTRVKDAWGRYVTSLNDVGLLKLTGALPDEAQPVGILDPDTKLPAQTSLLLAGYGIVNEIGEVQAATGLNKVRVPVVKVEGSILVADHRAGLGACRGDSGGPAFLESSTGLVLAAITRGSHEAALDCRSFGEYTSVSYHKEMILDQAQLMQAEAPKFIAVPELN